MCKAPTQAPCTDEMGGHMAAFSRQGHRFRRDEDEDPEDFLYATPEEQYAAQDEYYDDSSSDDEEDGLSQFPDEYAFAYQGDYDDEYDDGYYQPDYRPSSSYSDEDAYPVRSTGVPAFVRRHWKAYLIAALIAIALGAGAAVAVGIVGTTPPKSTTSDVNANTAPTEGEIESEATSTGDVNANSQ